MNYGTEEKIMCYECREKDTSEAIKNDEIKEKSSNNQNAALDSDKRGYENGKRTHNENDKYKYLDERNIVCTKCGFEGLALTKYTWHGFLEFKCTSCGRIDTNRLKISVRIIYWAFSALAVLLTTGMLLQGIIALPGLIPLIALFGIKKDADIHKRIKYVKMKKKYKTL